MITLFFIVGAVLLIANAHTPEEWERIFDDLKE